MNYYTEKNKRDEKQIADAIEKHWCLPVSRLNDSDWRIDFALTDRSEPSIGTPLLAFIEAKSYSRTFEQLSSVMVGGSKIRFMFMASLCVGVPVLFVIRFGDGVIRYAIVADGKRRLIEPWKCEARLFMRDQRNDPEEPKMLLPKEIFCPLDEWPFFLQAYLLPF